MFDFLSEKFSGVLARIRGSLSAADVERMVDQIRDALIEADVPHTVAKEFITSLRGDLTGMKMEKGLTVREQVAKGVNDALVRFLGGDAATLSFRFPSTILVMGLQGAGKTTTIAKLARFARKQSGKKPRTLLASVDFYRPAAIDQLEILAGRVGGAFYRSSQTDPIAAARDIRDHARANNYDLLFLDTAGRLQVDAAMMDELVRMSEAIKPDQRILVLDAMTGQESLKVARSFDDKVGFDGAILTKMDSDARGGAAFAFRYALKKPIFLVGIGEGIGDLARFHPDRTAQRMLGMGDLRTLAERATEVISKEEEEQAAARLASGAITLEDVANQLGMLNRLGPLSQVMQYMPGMGGAQVTPEMMQKGEQELVSFRAIINSMTPQERKDPTILGISRKKRVARGAGVSETQVDALLARFKQMQQYAKLLKGFGLLSGPPRS